MGTFCTNQITKMEGEREDQNVGSNGGSRWNPTKEQINMLEGLYKQGLRTPTAEQIQQITARLRDYGYIEGKNVFYWFQNHKARQRQKQKQETFAFYNRFLHSPTPIFPPPYQNVICSPCYIPTPKSDAMYYQQQPKVQLPTASGGFKRSRTSTESQSMEHISCSSHDQETLDLFPIHPTGILQSRSYDNDQNEFKNPSCSADNSPKLSTSSNDQPFFNFFSGN